MAPPSEPMLLPSRMRSGRGSSSSSSSSSKRAQRVLCFDTSSMSRMSKLVLYASAVFFFYLMYGALQVSLSVRPSGPSVRPSIRPSIFHFFHKITVLKKGTHP